MSWKKFVLAGVFYYFGLPDTIQQHKVAYTADALLVASGGVQQATCSEARQRGQTQCVNRGKDAVRLNLRQPTPAAGLDGNPHAPAHRFTVQQAPIVCQRFDGMPDSVTEVEDHAQAGF